MDMKETLDLIMDKKRNVKKNVIGNIEETHN